MLVDEAATTRRRHLPLRALRLAQSDPVALLSTLRSMARARYDLHGCRQVGRRPRIDGRCHIVGGEGIEIGESLTMDAGTVRNELLTHDGGQIRIGDEVFLNYGVYISAHTSVRIGDRCMIGMYSLLFDCDFHNAERLRDPNDNGSHGKTAPIVLEEDVWLAARVTVLRGVTIGRGSVIGAGSVVAKDVPAGVIAGGVPARILRAI